MTPSPRLWAAVTAIVASAAVMLAGVAHAGTSPDSGADAILWRTDRIDLQAESLTLESFDRAFSPAGAAVTITEGESGQRRWYVDVRWTADKLDHALVLNFRSNDNDWFIDSANWWSDDPARMDNDERYSSSSFPMRNVTRTPLGQALTGDISRSGTSVTASCHDTGLAIVRVDADGGTLTIMGLHLTVAPRKASLFERALRFIGLTARPEQNLGFLAPDCDDTGASWSVGPDSDPSYR